MKTVTAKLINGPHDGKILELDRTAVYLHIPVLTPVKARYTWDFEFDPSELVPSKTMVYVLHSHDLFVPWVAYFVYRGIQ